MKKNEGRGCSIAFWTWTGLAVVGLAVSMFFVLRTRVYTGTDIVLTASSDRILTIEGLSEITLQEAASSNVFVLYSNNGNETVAGTEKERPLFWRSGNKYFTAGPVSISPGQWIVDEKGELKIHLISDNPITITTTLTAEALPVNIFECLIFGAAIWIVVLVIMAIHASINDIPSPGNQ